ncbi:ABC transporter ATP-binding protein/permease [Demequina sp. NBRC 110053]|uniref:ABC transporter ATP-binding protein/permease n=1 Tax=Demequina sp. NBRC 110053 TaxID=1570342 RepID=UPI000A03F6F4|nr:ABC transporter transmembrane domain-containing protein [Demequina sp. NBRC 110053]
MRPVDPRLLARIGPARRYVIVTAALGLATAIIIGLQAFAISRALAPVLAPAPLTEDGLGWLGLAMPVAARDLSVALAWIGVLVALRVAITWVQERLAHRAGVDVIAALRARVVAHAARLGPRWVASGDGASITTTATRGLDGLLPYFVRYLPQLLLACTVTPLMLLVVLDLDWISAAIIGLTIPLVPIFMVLIGLLTQARSARHIEAMERLAARTLDLISGLPTLRALGRHLGPAARVRELGDRQRRATMGSLRIAFLSGMVLELLTTLAVALVAVTLGFRLVYGEVSIETALAVLVLAPEVYLPLRNVGTHFHASADGLAAADAAFAVLDTDPSRVGGSGPAPDLTGAAIVATGLTVATPDAARHAPHRLSFEARPGEVTALVGPNGDGKSTALLALMGLLAGDAGAVAARLSNGATVPLAEVDADAWARQCAWVPQRPDLGVEGRTMSLGQRERAALARAFESDRPVLVLDEPTAHLDSAARGDVVVRIRAAAAVGRTVIVASHEPALIGAADRVVEVLSSRAASG